jgi:hypothetical protein
MKKTLLILSLIVLTVFAAEAQKARVGLKGGLNFANLDAEFDTDSKTGFHFGAFAEFGAGGFSIMPELLFSAKGSKEINLTYVEIPVLLKKSFAKVMNIHVGPQFGFLTKAEDDDDGQDIKDQLKGSDVSAVFGAGVDLPGGLTAGARYVLGLGGIEDFDGATEIKNKTFQIYVGYKLFGK